MAAAVPCSLLGYRDAGGEGHRYGGGLAASRLGALLEGGRARPVARAVSSSWSAALLRSASAGFIARGLFVVGVALTLSGLIGLALRDIGYSAPVLPAQPLHAPAFVLPFFALVGLRLSAVYPASLEANWIFRLTEVPGSADYAAGRATGGAADRRPARCSASWRSRTRFSGARSPPPPTSRWRSRSRS